MWGKNEQPAAPPSVPASVREETKAAPTAGSPPVVARSATADGNSSSGGRIGKSVVMKAQISAKEDLYIDGELEGTVELPGYNLIVGPNGKLAANVKARNVAVHGVLRGNVQAAEKVEIRKTGSLLGDLTTAGVTIEDGAYFKGSIDIVRPAPAQKKTEAAPVAAVAPAAARAAGD
jgi:cytoskeletal protein CcmA (bactofilin family)